MKHASTFVILFVILVFVVATFKVKENFQNPSLYIPNTKVPQQNLVQSSKEEDYAPSYTSLSGPLPGTIASVNSLPFRDPANESANYKDLLNIQTTLKGFLDTEAPNIQELSDPSIQLPLTSARADLNRLQNEILVLKRNPGIDSSITQNNLNEIQANLSWLQNKYRDSVYNEIEGFQDGSGAVFSSSGSNVGSNTPIYAGSNVVSNVGSNVGSNAGSNANPPIKATKQDLVDIVQKINDKIVTLSASGTTNPVTVMRIEVLNRMKQKIQDIINDINSGKIKEADITMTKQSKDEFLKIVNSDDNSSPLSVLLSTLFGSSSQADTKNAQKLFEKYIDTLFKGLSWDFNMKYISDNEVSIANARRQLNNNYVPQGYFNDVINNAGSNINFDLPVYNQGQNQIYQTHNQQPNKQPPKDNYEQRFETPTQNKSSIFDWHERANFICEAIQKRGLNSKDFGCLGNNEYVSENFSWRGYAKMICTRLGTSYDTGLPETCGCPSASWPGWKP